MAEHQWARLRADLDCDLRRGAWYRIIEMARLEVIVDVRGTPVSVPRPFVEILAAPPRRWGPYYGVCPSCGDRAPLLGRPASMRCQRCNGVFAVAWSETYVPTAL